jgi:hypothetical protein
MGVLSNVQVLPSDGSSLQGRFQCTVMMRFSSPCLAVVCILCELQVAERQAPGTAAACSEGLQAMLLDGLGHPWCQAARAVKTWFCLRSTGLADMQQPMLSVVEPG